MSTSLQVTGAGSTQSNARDVQWLSTFIGRRLKKRLERAVTRAVTKPSRAMPTLRRLIDESSAQLRVQSIDDARIRSALTQMIEDVVRVHHLNDRSLLTGDPRWFALIERVDEWITASS